MLLFTFRIAFLLITILQVIATVDVTYTSDGSIVDPLSDMVASQYQRYRYPEPVIDIPSWLEKKWQLFDPSHSHLLFWPDRKKLNKLDILVAGCGTNQAALLAYTNPTLSIVAIDVSKPSLDHQRELKVKYKLDNLELQLLPIEEVQSLNREFDLIISTGVLHHMADPTEGLRSLSRCLRIDGVVAIMLYGHYGRIGVEILQGVFKEMGLSQDKASVEVVKTVLASLPEDHPVMSYMATAPDLDSDAGLVDTFLHGRERSYTVDQCLELVESSGLVFSDWCLKSSYYPKSVIPSNAFEASIATLSIEQQWSVMERMFTHNGCHFFTASRADRPKSSYKIDFSAERFLDFLPSLRYLCKLDGTRISRHDDWGLNLDQRQVTLVRLADGKKTIREILAVSSSSDHNEAVELEYARVFFESLWRLDFLVIGLPSQIDGH